MSAQISAVIKACVAGLRRIRSVRRWIPRRALLTLIQALVVSKVDYCNSVLAGVSGTQLRRLQSVLNAAARLVFSARRSEHITPLLRELHWLRDPERMKFRLCVLALRCLHGTVSRYLAETLQLTTSCSCRRRLRSVDTDRSSYASTDPWRSCVSSCGCRAWNSLPSSVRDVQSLATFRQQLKTLFSTSFGEDANTGAASRSTRDFIV